MSILSHPAAFSSLDDTLTLDELTGNGFPPVGFDERFDGFGSPVEEAPDGDELERMYAYFNAQALEAALAVRAERIEEAQAVYARTPRVVFGAGGELGVNWSIYRGDTLLALVSEEWAAEAVLAAARR